MRYALLFVPEKALKPEVKITNVSMYSEAFHNIENSIRAYLELGLTSCPEPNIADVEAHVNLFCDRLTMTAYKKNKEEGEQALTPRAVKTTEDALLILKETLL